MSPSSAGHVAFGLGVKKPQMAICDEAKLPRAKVMDTRAVNLPKGGNHLVAHLSRRNDDFARKIFFGCHDSRLLFKPKAIAGRHVRDGDENEYPFIVGRYGNRIMAETPARSTARSRRSSQYPWVSVAFRLRQRGKGTNRQRARTDTSPVPLRGLST